MGKKRVMRPGQCGDGHASVFEPGWHCTRDSGHDGPCALVPIEDMVIDKKEGAAMHRRALDAARLEKWREDFGSCCTWRVVNALDEHEGSAMRRQRLGLDRVEIALGDAVFCLEERDGEVLLRLKDGAILVEPVCSNVVKLSKKDRP